MFTRGLVHETAKVASTADIRTGVSIGEDSVVGEYATVGTHSVVLDGVTIGEGVRIGPRGLILDNAVVCRNPVYRTSSDSRKIEDHVSVGPGVLLHDEVELGYRAIIPTQRTIMSLGNFGKRTE
jgi:UDP-3-O-[3-hydroxymyristoyl] glucosamine N-acyltransferase